MEEFINKILLGFGFNIYLYVVYPTTIIVEPTKANLNAIV
jgi:hypothetical protein